MAGPYETEQAALAEPLATAVRNLPHNPVDPGRAARDLQLSYLREACADADVELGGHDRRILTWLASYEPATVQVVIGLISRAGDSRETAQLQIEQAQAAQAAAEDRALELALQLDRTRADVRLLNHRYELALDAIESVGGFVTASRIRAAQPTGTALRSDQEGGVTRG